MFLLVKVLFVSFCFAFLNFCLFNRYLKLLKILEERILFLMVFSFWLLYFSVGFNIR